MTASNDTVFIYVLQRLSDKACLYVGSAKNPKRRFYRHSRENPYPEIKRAFGEGDIQFVVIAATDEQHRIEVETRLWRQFRDAGHPIKNSDPSLVHTQATYGPRRQTEEAKRKISESNRGRRWSDESRRKASEDRKGRRLSEEHKQKIGAASKGNNHNKGRVLTEEHKQKISAAEKGRPIGEETRRKISLAKTGKQHPPISEETRRKLCEAQRTRRAREASNG